MLRQIPQLVFFVLCFLGAKEMKAQKMYNVTIELPASMSSQKFTVHVNDGIENTYITDSFTRNTLNLTGVMYSDSITLDLRYELNNTKTYSYSYFVNDSPAKFLFKESSKDDLEDPFENCDITNALNINEMPLELKRRDFIKAEGNEINLFLEKNHPSNEENDSFQIKFQQKMQKFMNKQLEFIEKYPDEYYSFYLFRTQIAFQTLSIFEYDPIQVQKLNTFFNTVFSKKFTESREGKALQEKLKPRQPIKENASAPNFEATDIHGNKIALNSLRGKYVLLDFWATWCPPCMEQIPFLKSLRETYSADDLVIISISADRDRKQFEKVIRGKQMDWIHIYDKTVLPDQYSIRAYPTLVLIDANGVIVYDGKNQTLEKLTKLLKER
ncbi:MAG: thioredoxin-like domain-containing protein [Ginsengibacter sp.]|jgi:thiol-disulfide isomerase/thioredoxin